MICALAKRTPPVSVVEIHCVRILTISNSSRRMSSNPFLRCGPIGDGRAIISMDTIKTSIALELPRFNKWSADRLTCPSCIPSPWTLLRSYKGVASECSKCAIHAWVELFDLIGYVCTSLCIYNVCTVCVNVLQKFTERRQTADDGYCIIACLFIHEESVLNARKKESGEIVSGVDIDDFGDLRHITAPRFHFSSIKMHGSFSITFVHAVHRDAFRFFGPWKGKAVIVKSCMYMRDKIYYTQVASRSFIRPGAGVSSSSNDETIVGFCLRTLTTHLNRVDGLQSGVLSTESLHGGMAGMTCLWMAATVILHIHAWRA